MTAIVLLALASRFVAPLAHAGDTDFADEARNRMKLSFDLDSVEAELAAPAAAAPRAPPASAAPYRAGYIVPVVRRLPLDPNSVLDRVVVLRDRALVTRVRTVKLAAGAQRVRFEGLPIGLAADALHAQVRDGNGRVVGVELVSGAGDVEETGRIAKIRTDAKVFAEQLGAVQDHIESLLMQRAYLRGALLPGNGDTRPPPTLDVVKGALVFAGEAERDLAAKLRADEAQAKELGEKLEPLLVKLKDPLATGMTVRVDLDMASATTVSIALGYTVGGASWTPSYNARLDPDANTVTLETNALVSQATGEDWTNATLQLSTANAVVGGSAPRLDPWVIDESGVSSAAFAESGAARTGAGALVMDVPGRRTIAGDGSEARIPLTAGQFPTVLSLTTVPRLMPEVFRSAGVTWTGETPLLPGPVASFVGADYVGSAALAAVAPGEAVDLGFGVDDRIKVDRKLVDRQVDHLRGGRTRTTVQYRTTVHNFGSQPRIVRLTDQVPVSQTDRVTVTAIAGTPADPRAEGSDASGIQHWTLTIPPGGISTVELGFTVTAPRELSAQMDMMMM